MSTKSNFFTLAYCSRLRQAVARKPAGTISAGLHSCYLEVSVSFCVLLSNVCELLSLSSDPKGDQIVKGCVTVAAEGVE